MGAPGCDDAPVVDITIGDKAKCFTLIVPYYENPNFLVKQIQQWSRIEDDLRKYLKIIIVDDGSPSHSAESVLRKYSVANLRHFKIDVDVRWNWLAARNVGAHYADDGWIMTTDMDHVLPSDTFDTLVYGQHDPNVIYRFSREEHTGEKIHAHPNSWFMTRKMYWRVGGYDEALSGNYGTDGEYRRRCAKTAKIKIMSCPLVRHEYVGDSSTTHYKRKQPQDARGKQLIKARGPGWKPKVLSFPHHEVLL